MNNSNYFYRVKFAPKEYKRKKLEWQQVDFKGEFPDCFNKALKAYIELGIYVRPARLEVYLVEYLSEDNQRELGLGTEEAKRLQNSLLKNGIQ